MENAAIIRRELSAAGLTVYGGEHAPYVWIKTPDGMDSWGFFDHLLNKAHVVGTPGSGFGAAGEGYFRLSAFNSRANVDEAMHQVTDQGPLKKDHHGRSDLPAKVPIRKRSDSASQRRQHGVPTLRHGGEQDPMAVMLEAHNTGGLVRCWTSKRANGSANNVAPLDQGADHQRSGTWPVGWNTVVSTAAAGGQPQLFLSEQDAMA